MGAQDNAIFRPKTRKSLFRREAIESFETVWSGNVLLIRPLTFTFYTFFSILVLTLTILFLSWGWYTKKETSIGYVRPMGGVSGIVAPVRGVISKLHVSEGERVGKGDLLVTIRTEIENIDGAISQQIGGELKEQLNYLIQESENRLAMIELERESSMELKKFSEVSLASLKERLSLLKRNQEYLKQDYQAVETLFKAGSVSKTEYSNKSRELNLGRIKVAEVEDNIMRLENEIRMLSYKSDTAELEIEQIKVELGKARSKHNQRMVEISRSNEYVLRSPVDGTVSTILLTETNTIPSGRKLLSIIPVDNKWVAELFVPTRAIAYIDSGSKVNIKYDAFPYQKFGLYEGVVQEVSRTVLIPADLPEQIRITEPVYRLTVRLEKQLVTLKEKQYQLQAGMSLSAEIESETRKLHEWMLGPVMDIKRKIGGTSNE